MRCSRGRKRRGPQHLDQILEFLMVFVDRCHHAKEEERVGHGKHEEFHRMMDRLKAAYRI